MTCNCQSIQLIVTKKGHVIKISWSVLTKILWNHKIWGKSLYEYLDSQKRIWWFDFTKNPCLLNFFLQRRRHVTLLTFHFFCFNFTWKLRNYLFTFSAFRNYRSTIDNTVQQNLSQQTCFVILKFLKKTKVLFKFWWPSRRVPSISNLLKQIHCRNLEPFCQNVLVTIFTSFITFQNSSTYIVNMAKVLGK